jgi:hypothetical protein
MAPEEVADMLESLPPSRGRALAAFLTVATCRIGEACHTKSKEKGVKRSQFVFDVEPGFVLIKDFAVEKKLVGLRIREEVALPLRGPFGRLTAIFLEYFNSTSGEWVFPFCIKSGYNYVVEETPKWPHYYRAVGENTWLTLFRGDAMRAAKYLNIEVGSMANYIKSDWRNFSPYILAGSP